MLHTHASPDTNTSLHACVHTAKYCSKLILLCRVISHGCIATRTLLQASNIKVCRVIDRCLESWDKCVSFYGAVREGSLERGQREVLLSFEEEAEGGD